MGRNPQKIRCQKRKTDGTPCKAWAVTGKDGCRVHNGGDGRPVVHALYSKHIPTDWQLDYEYFKTDPKILSLESDIAVARVARARFLKQCEGARLSAEIVDTLLEHGIKIGKLVEIHNKVQFGERQVITIDQLQQEIAQIADIINTAFDAGGTPDEIRVRIAEGLVKLGEGK